MNEHENQTMKIFGKRLTASLLGAALVMSMPFASALTQKNITVERGVTVYVDDQKLNPGDANGNSVEPMLYMVRLICRFARYLRRSMCRLRGTERRPVRISVSIRWIRMR